MISLKIGSQNALSHGNSVGILQKLWLLEIDSLVNKLKKKANSDLLLYSLARLITLFENIQFREKAWV